MSITFLLAQPFAQHALAAAALVAVSCGLIGPFVVTRGMSFAVHGTAELAFTGAAAGLIVADNPVAGALAGSLVVAALIATLGARPRERDSAIGAILAFGLGIGVLLLGFYQGFATAARSRARVRLPRRPYGGYGKSGGGPYSSPGPGPKHQWCACR
jgi:zinc/manganese transport system permease protein